MASLPEQKKKFEDAFQRLVEQAPVNAKNLWDGHFYWVDLPGRIPSQVKIDHVVNFFPPELKDRYGILLRQLKDELIP